MTHMLHNFLNNIEVSSAWPQSITVWKNNDNIRLFDILLMFLTSWDLKLWTSKFEAYTHMISDSLQVLTAFKVFLQKGSFKKPWAVRNTWVCLLAYILHFKLKPTHTNTYNFINSNKNEATERWSNYKSL